MVFGREYVTFHYFIIWRKKNLNWLFTRECELWCGISEANINVFSIKQSVVLECKTLCHFELSNDTFVSLMDTSENYVYSYVSPGSTLYQWNNKTKIIKNRLDCSKLVPCSESLWSISIEENLSPGKCQVCFFLKIIVSISVILVLAFRYRLCAFLICFCILVRPGVVL